jgi:hypothetical protein
VYRHAHAFDLFEKRKANVRGALEALIERAADVEVTASAVVAAIQAYARSMTLADGSSVMRPSASMNCSTE